MRLYGYAHKDTGRGLLEMREVTVVADPTVLRAMAKFLSNWADSLEKSPANLRHEHFTPPSVDCERALPRFVVSTV